MTGYISGNLTGAEAHQPDPCCELTSKGQILPRSRSQPEVQPSPAATTDSLTIS